MIYLVQFDLERYEYPDERYLEPGLTRLVEAASADEAERKLKSHYSAQSSDYAVSYYPVDVRVHETIR